MGELSVRPRVLMCVAALFLGGMSGCYGDVGDDEPAGAPDAGMTPPDAAQAVPDAAVPVQLPCIAGDAQVQTPDGTCYMLVYGGPEDAATVDWEGAKTACATFDAHLVTITDDNEHDLIADLAEAAAATGTPMTNSRDDYWIGANDNDVEDTFIWDNGEAFIFDAWRDGEPNNNGGGGLGENCAIVEGDRRTWDDRNCANTYGYVCERPPVVAN